MSVPYAQVQIAGDANAAVLGSNDTIAQISSLTDAAANAYQLAIGSTTNAPVRILMKIFCRPLKRTVTPAQKFRSFSGT